MSDHKVTALWERQTDDFSYASYNRAHTWNFDHGIIVDASAAEEYQGDPNLVDPEQAFVAALSSCHMLTFLAIACQKKYVIDRYEDHAVGTLAKNEQGKMAMTKVTLQPKIAFSGDNVPDAAALQDLHHKAHEYCFLANSVTTEVEVI